MKKLSIEKIIENWIINYLGLDKYEYIMNNFEKTDVSIDKDFQRKFNSFYVVRRNTNWRKIYYDYMEKIKIIKVLLSQRLLHTYIKKQGI